MKCHYEVLSVSRDVGDEEIKKSYRKLALKWHPDKNPDNIEECTEQFRLIQQAYDVLSDPQERAWYDKHRDAILHGGLGRGDYEDDCLDVFLYFNTSCYSGFGDDDNGFYSIYRNVFDTISQEDYKFMDLSEDDDFEIPSFGRSDTDPQEVVNKFYGYWSSYCTARSYVWKEKYDIREGPDRRTRRMIEAENKKFRDAAKKERNEEVRQLVAFVKKRDKRVKAYKEELEKKAAEIAMKNEEKRKEQIREQKRLMENYKETAWSSSSQVENELKQLESLHQKEFGEENSEDSLGEEEEEEMSDLFCVACNKAFKSDKAFANHERSKKHKENVFRLKEEMEKEDEFLLNDNQENNVSEENACDNQMNAEKSMDMEEDMDTEEISTDRKHKLSKKQKKKKKQQRLLAQSNEEEDGNNLEDLSNIVEEKLEINGKSKSSPKVSPEPTTQTEEKTVQEPNQESPQESNQESEKEPTDKSPRDSSERQNKPKKNIVEEKAPAQLQFCNTCGKDYPTRNKLFEHLRESGHQNRIANSNSANTTAHAKGSKKGKKKDRR